jgi:hypothetical protein
MIFPEESLVCCRVSPQTRGFDQEQRGNTAGLFEASARRGSKHEEMHADAPSCPSGELEVESMSSNYIGAMMKETHGIIECHKTSQTSKNIIEHHWRLQAS